MSIAQQVRRFYEELWNQRDLSVVDDILDEAVTFRGSLGSTHIGRTAVCEYVTTVTTALHGYHCELEMLVAEGNTAGRGSPSLEHMSGTSSDGHPLDARSGGPERPSSIRTAPRSSTSG